MRTVTSGSRRSTWFFFERIPPTRRTIPWESASLIMPSKRFPRTANVPPGSSADSMFETSSGSYVPRCLPTLCVMPSLPATPSRAEGSKSATRYPGPRLTTAHPPASASMQRTASAKGMSFDSPDSSKKYWVTRGYR